MIPASEIFWQIISAAAAIGGIIIAVIIFFATRRGRVKQLQAVVLSKTTLLNPEVRSARQNLRITYQDTEVSDVSIIQIRIRNSGSQPIRSQDIDQPITIISEGVEEIISADILSPRPPELSVTPSLVGNLIQLNTGLLNPDDEFIVEIASVPQSHKESSVKIVTARIAGVKQIDFQPSLPSHPMKPVYGVLTFAAAAAAAAIFAQTIIYYLIRALHLP